MTQKHFLFKSNAFLVRVVETSQRRTIFKPPRNTPYFGIYRTNGEICRKDDILVSQRNLNYHPGANVSWQPYCGQHLLKANCDGTVMITREKCEPNPEMEIMQENYASRNYENIFKLTFNVIPRRMSKRFTLIDEE